MEGARGGGGRGGGAGGVVIRRAPVGWRRKKTLEGTGL